VTRARNYLKKAKNLLIKQADNIKLRSILEDTNAYYQKAEAKFKIYNIMLDEIRGKFANKIS